MTPWLPQKNFLKIGTFRPLIVNLKNRSCSQKTTLFSHFSGCACLHTGILSGPPWASIVLTTKNLGPYCHLNHWKWTGYHLRLKQDLPEGPTLQFWKVSKSCFFSFLPFLPFCLAYKSSAIHQQKLPLLEELSAKDTSACESERTNTVKNNLWKNPWILRVTLKWYFSDFFQS